MPAQLGATRQAGNATDAAPWRRSLTEQGAAAPTPDLVNRDFTAERAGEKMVGDITYSPTWQGWLHLATVIDCATRKIVGWAVDDNYPTRKRAREDIARWIELRYE
jgi:transposase InsO family protein